MCLRTALAGDVQPCVAASTELAVNFGAVAPCFDLFVRSRARHLALREKIPAITCRKAPPSFLFYPVANLLHGHWNRV